VTTLVKLRKSTTYVPGSPGQPGYPGRAAIPASCTTVTTSTLKKELVQIHPGIAPPLCTLGELLPPGYGLGSTCPMPPAYALVTTDPPEYIYSTSTVCTPYQPAIPAIPYEPATPAQTIIDYNLGWNCGANSIEQLTNGSFTFEPSVGSQGVIIGLSKNTYSSGYSDIEFGFHVISGSWRIIENGVPVSGYTAFTDGQVFEVERQADEVKYYIDDVLKYTSLQTPSSPDYYLKASMYAGDDLIDAAALNAYFVGSGSGDITLPGIEPVGIGHYGTEAYSWTDLGALTSTATGYGVSWGDPVLPAMISHGYADFEAVGYSILPGLRGEGQLLNSNGIDGGGAGTIELPAMTGFGYEPGYEYGDVELPSLGSYASAGLLATEFISSDIAIFSPQAGYAHGITGEVGTGAATLPAMDSLASEGVYGESFTEISPPRGYAYSWGGGGLLNQYIPFTFSLIASGKKVPAALQSRMIGDVPGFTFEGYTGGQVVGNVPSMSVDIQASVPIVGRLTKKVPSLSLNSTGRAGGTSALISNVPAITMAGYAGGHLVGSVPVPTLGATATGGSTGAIIIKFPRPKFVGKATARGGNALIGEVPPLAMGGVARLTGMVPDIWLRSTATQVIAVAPTEGYNVNIQNGAVTSHDYMPIIKIVQWGQEYYGVGPNGVYRMEGLDIDGTPIVGEMSISGIGNESEYKKRLEPIYFRHRSSGNIEVTVTPDEGTPRVYTLYAETDDDLVTRRAKVARGMTGKSWDLKATGTLDIDSVLMKLNEVNRRLG
jgi:hypothetical protein